jgi:hypothetical protein
MLCPQRSRQLCWHAKLPRNTRIIVVLSWRRTDAFRAKQQRAPRFRGGETTAFQRKTVKIEPNPRAARAWRRRTIKVKKTVRNDKLYFVDSIGWRIPNRPYTRIYRAAWSIANKVRHGSIVSFVYNANKLFQIYIWFGYHLLNISWILVYRINQKFWGAFR